ncbi:RcnB family protein [Phytohalomonas tamaricis]|uniref:RcnB family protein n=1 Tax=Phytohalomonas tamaricis TaxID=2081032 RepID=UPI000D0AD1B4|nr:RcnB family protein [Phytohalomonas tamaricis]
MTLRRKLTLYSACIVVALSCTVTLAAPGNDHAPHQADNHGQQAKRQGPQIDEKKVRDSIEKHRGQFGDADPGNNGTPQFAKGKKLPNDVPARPLDRRVAADLPHYEGYEWRRVGTNLILVSVATGVIYEVFNHVLN